MMIVVLKSRDWKGGISLNEGLQSKVKASNHSLRWNLLILRILETKSASFHRNIE